MPRDLSAVPSSWRTNLARQCYALGFSLVIEAPSGDITVSDVATEGRRIVKSWGGIAPMLVEGEGSPEAQSFDVVISNVDVSGARVADDLNETGIEGVTCTLYAINPVDGTRMRVFKGKFQQLVSASAHEVVIRIDGQGAYTGKALDHLVSADYPQAPPAHAQRLKPIVYGAIADFPPVPVDVGVISELEEALSSGATTATIKEDVSRFPSAGVVQFSGSELATYTGRNTTDNTLTGLTRGAYGTPASAHPAGAVVMQRPSAYKFLVADPAFGKIDSVRKVRIGGREVGSSRWSVNRTTCELTVQPFARSAGRPTYNRIQAINRGLTPPGQPTAMGSLGTTALNTRAFASGVRMVADNIQSRPITNCAHNSMVPWAAPSSAYFWNNKSDTTPSATDKQNNTSTVTLVADTPKTWGASYFDSYAPPSGIFVRSGISVGISVMPALRRAWYTNGRWEMKLEDVRLARIDCTVGGVTKSWYPSGDDVFSSPQYTTDSASGGLGRPIPQQHIEFAFTSEEVDPEAGPYDVTLEAVTDGTVVGHVCRVQALVQSIDGVLPWTAITGAVQATLDQDSPSDTEIVLTFPNSYEYAVLAIAYRCFADYVKVDMGGGKVARFQPSSIDDSPMGNSDVTTKLGGWMTSTIIVQNPSTTIKVQARDFGADTASPVIITPGVDDFIHVGGATLTGLSSGSALYPLLKDVSAESVFLATFGEYPTIDVRGYEDSSGALMEHPADCIEHYMTQVMGESGVDCTTDRSSFPASYKFGGAIVDVEDMRLPLVRMVRDARSWMFWDPMSGLWRLKYRLSAAQAGAASADWTWTPADWLAGLPQLTRTADADLVDKVNIRWMRDWSQARALEAYANVTSSGSGTRTADERYCCDFVRSQAMATDLASFYAGWDTVATRRTAVAARIAHIACLKGDIVSLSLPIGGSSPTDYLQGVNASKFIVLGTGLSFHDYNSGTPTSVPVLLQEVP